MKLQVPFIVFPLFASAQSLGGGTRFSISHSGRGCPVGSMSVSASMSPDREIMTLSFDKMQAFIGPGYDATSKTQNCGINLTMELPNDSTQYTLVENTYHGYERLEKGITATLLSTLYRSENATASITTQASVEGSSVGQVFTRTVVVPESQYVWSRCGGVRPCGL
ncbi:hypothetical protein B0T21DRAFT_176091 [Apiosordaria backusii]|uniref:Uncharacterized protein n=1 Tax=Apiosordaria backusii TaxID=314023 RepID=A0AA40BL15_9PEZI|nr:hypothetical protein B0T21DRAFT_176091 [Apiosordaria backusii]